MPDLPEPDPTRDAADAPPKRRRRYKLLVALVLLVLGALWLNGPGFRMIAPFVAIHYLEKLGIRGDFKVEGDVARGVSVSELVIEGDEALGKLTIERVVPEYSLRGLREGRLEGLTFEGVHADLRLSGEKKEEEKTPLDLKALTERLRTVRSRVMPMNLEVKDFTLTAFDETEKPVLRLGPSNITHEKDSEVFNLQLGTITDATGHEWPAQNAKIFWKEGSLALERLDPLPGVSLRDLVIETPADGDPSMDARLHLNESVFSITSPPGLSSVKVDLLEGSLQIADLAKRFNLELPGSVTVSSFSMDLEQVLPDPKAATGSVRILLENGEWQDWASPEIAIDATLESDRASVAARGIFFDTPLALNAEAPVRRGNEMFEMGDLTGTFIAENFPQLVKGLAPRIAAIDPSAPVPPSALSGSFTAPMISNKVASADITLQIKSTDESLAPSIQLQGQWAPDQPIEGKLTTDGLVASATYQPTAKSYQAAMEFDEFTSSRVEPWLAIVKARPGGVGNLSGKWSGSGETQAGRHRGELDLAQGTWSREGMPPVTAIGAVRYDWPGSFETDGLRLAMERQSVELEAAMKDQVLSVPKFRWSLDDQTLAEGSARLPVPADFTKWRDTLANDESPVEVSLTTETLSLGLLKEWVPALEALDERSTGKVNVSISGTYAEPVIAAKIDAKELRSPARPNLPPADLSIEITGREGRLRLEGTAMAADFPAAVIRASMPFRPADWAKVPGEFKNEPIEARVDLPRVDVSRFTTLVPAAERLQGTVSGNIVVGGTIGAPEMQGSVDLSGGGVTLKNSRIPPVEGLSASVDLSQERIVLKNLKSTVAGGTLQGEGTLTVVEGKFGNLDLRLRASHLPIVRNELILLRANADLRAQGPWERAAVTGTMNTVDSIFYRDIELLPIGTPFTAPSAAAVPKLDKRPDPTGSVPEPFSNWTLDVDVSAREPILIRGNFANGNVRGSIRLGGTIGDPAPDGTLTLKDFRASLPFSTLYVRSGTATFTPESGFDPILEIRGTAEPRPYRVTIYAYGRASDPQLVLTSNPPLPDNEIMTLLATGTTTAGLEDPQAASSRALQLLVEELRRGRFRFGRSLRPVLALLDRVDFSLAEADPYTSETFSTATLSITDRWFLSAGVGATGDTRILALWRLTFR